MDFNKMFEYVTTHFSPNIILYIGIGVIIILLLRYLNKFLSYLEKYNVFKWIKNIRSISKEYKITKKDLEKHYFFTHLNYLRNIKLNMLNFGDDARNYTIKLLMKYRLNFIEKNIKDLILRDDLECLRTDELEQIIIDISYNGITQCIADFEKEARTEEERKIASFIVGSVWRSYNENQVDIGINGLKDILTSPIYENNLIRIYTVLLPIAVSMESFLVRMEQSLKNLNGNLSNKSFHGYTFK